LNFRTFNFRWETAPSTPLQAFNGHSLIRLISRSAIPSGGIYDFKDATEDNEIIKVDQISPKSKYTGTGKTWPKSTLKKSRIIHKPTDSDKPKIFISK
jgi:hypothetical protein